MTQPHSDATRAGPDPNAVAAAHAIYAPLMLSVYDQVVHGLSNRFAWRCPTERLLSLYRTNLSANHLEAGVGTGFFIDRAGSSRFERLVLLDINRNCLAISAKRLARFHPELVEANLFAPLALPPFDSIGLTYILHCLPGSMVEKLAVIDNLRSCLRDGGVLFGATILGRFIEPNLAARALLRLYNAKGVFNNFEDDLPALREGLQRRFDDVRVESEGCVALFAAR